jgi:hypothetical protein
MKFKPKLDPVTVVLLLTALVMIYMALMLIRAFVPNAYGGTAALTWTAPTQNCDGSPITGLTGYRLLYGTADSGLPATPTAYTVTGLAPGTWFFSLAAVTATAQSEFVTVTKIVASTDFKTTDTVAYTIVKKVDGLVFLPVGSVPVGTVCDATMKVGAYYVVPRASVTWSGTIKPDVVVGTCG